MLDLRPLPMEDAIAFWKDKYLLSPGQYRQLSDEAKTRAFAISGIAKGDELSTVFAAMQRAIEEGTTFDEFKKAAGDIFARRGWTGKAAWRVETIFRTNIQTAYSVGRYKEMVAVKRDRPYWQYSAVNDSRTRPTHWAMNGKVFPADHPFWDTWYPPNGYNCFPSGTFVAIQQGWKLIEELRVGDFVVGGSGNLKGIRAVYKRPFDGNLIQLTSKDISVMATPNHRVLTIDGWRLAGNLKPGDILVQTGKVAFFDLPVMDIDEPDSCGGDSSVSLSGFNLKMPHQVHERTGINMPEKTDFPVGKSLSEITTGEGFADGAPLKGFNSLDDFRTWAFLHADLRKVDNIKSIPYKGDVFNLSVLDDESYCVPISIVHNCRCGVVTISQDDVDSEGLKVETEDPTGGLIEPVDPVSGNKLPARPLMPDQGFAHNPGKESWGMQEKETDLAKYIDMPGHGDAADYRLRKLDNIRAKDIPDMKGEMLPGKMGDAFYKSEFEKRYGVEKVLTDAIGEPVIVSLRNYLVNKTPGAPEIWKFSKDGHGESIPLLQEMIESPLEIWLTPQQDSLTGKIRLTKRYIGFWKTDDKERIGGLMVFEVVKGQFQGVTAFLPLKKDLPDIAYVNKQRYGLLLYK
ncbi:MAG: phage minor head protein [Candidatus Brocadia sp.]|nr:phage minor head protein [Candidatus Brocadia sp.]